MVEVHEGIAGPDSSLQLLAGNYFAGSFQQGREDLERLLLQLQLSAVFQQLAAARIECAIPESPKLFRLPHFRPEM